MECACFELVIPLKAEYVSVARLTVSGVANRAGFDFDSIEDIKVALAEVCNRLIRSRSARGDALADGNAPKSQDASEEHRCRMQFLLSEQALTIHFFVDEEEAASFLGGSDESDEFSKLGLSLLNLLMDEFEVNRDEGCVISMKKYLGVCESGVSGSMDPVQ